MECGDLYVPEDRTQANTGIIRLHVIVFKSTNSNPQPDPVIHLVGGPGGSLLDTADTYLERGGDQILKTRDYILFNQRGTRYAEPFLECPGRTEHEWELAGQGLSLSELNQRRAKFLLDCQDELLKQGINLSAYNSRENAADVEDLRISLGYEQVNLYGISYGSRLALTMMRDNPGGIRSVILDAVLPPQANLNQEIGLNIYRSLNAVFDDCAADSACSAAHPNLEGTFYRVVDDLNANPAFLEFLQGPILLDGHGFLDAILRLLYSIDAIPWIPFLIDEASRGAYPEPSIFAIPDRDSQAPGMRYSVWCQEEMTFESLETALALSNGLPSVFRDTFIDTYDWVVCDSWQAGAADPIENEAVASDIPTLIFAGRYDPITPPEWARLAAKTLPNHFIYPFSNAAHGVMRSNPCALEIGLQFLDDPTKEPDSSCVAELPSIVFE